MRSKTFCTDDGPLIVDDDDKFWVIVTTPILSPILWSDNRKAFRNYAALLTATLMMCRIRQTRAMPSSSLFFILKASVVSEDGCLSWSKNQNRTVSGSCSWCAPSGSVTAFEEVNNLMSPLKVCSYWSKRRSYDFRARWSGRDVEDERCKLKSPDCFARWNLQLESTNSLSGSCCLSFVSYPLQEQILVWTFTLKFILRLWLSSYFHLVAS